MTIGIHAYGGYVPQLRLERSAIAGAHAWFNPALKGLGKGQRAMANWDEDSVTMALEAARDCLGTAAVTDLGAVYFAFQIYGDFSGYSDIAIGTAKLFGIQLMTNFKTPYFSRDIAEFWRRWHISLSTWFRDYLYIPLGGNRKGRVRTGVNLVAVFLLCGVWHGAAWTFVVWGAWHGALLVLERVGGGALLARLPRPVGHAWTLLLVCLGWVPFNATSMDQAVEFWSALAGLGSSSPAWPAARFLAPSVTAALLLGAVASVPWFPWVRTRLEAGRLPARPVLLWGADLALVAVLVFSLAEGLGGTSTPFIYFRF